MRSLDVTQPTQEDILLLRSFTSLRRLGLKFLKEPEACEELAKLSFLETLSLYECDSVPILSAVRNIHALRNISISDVTPKHLFTIVGSEYASKLTSLSLCHAPTVPFYWLAMLTSLTSLQHMAASNLNVQPSTPASALQALSVFRSLHSLSIREVREVTLDFLETCTCLQALELEQLEVVPEGSLARTLRHHSSSLTRLVLAFVSISIRVT